MDFPTPERRTVEMRDITVARFQTEVRPAARPVILKGLVAGWPAVQAGTSSAADLAEHLTGFATPRPVRFIIAPPDRQGAFFYNETLSGVNFDTRQGPLGELLKGLIHWIDKENPPAIAAQSMLASVATPGFSAVNVAPEIVGDTPARLWIGNAAVVPTHHDMYENLACAVAGRRRFILFPPSAVADLYVGPFERTLAGALVSLVRLHDPDPIRWPRFTQAWAKAEVADLEPGDALYIPYMWWHHVQSFDPFSMLVNYWWNDDERDLRPKEALVHAMAVLRDLPQDQKAVWQSMFDAFVFTGDAEPGQHIPEAARGVQTRLDPASAQALVESLARSILQRGASRGQ